MMKKALSLILSACLLMAPVMANAEEVAPAHSEEEVRALLFEELQVARNVAYYPAAFEGDFIQFYVDFHTLSRKLRTGLTGEEYDAVLELTRKREALTQVAEPADTVWEIWGEQMASEPMPEEGWDLSYDNEGFRPFLNPYLLEDQSQVKGNVIIIAGGSNTHRCDQVEGYPVAEYFNENGYNAYVLQRRVLPYADIDPVLDLARAIRYIRYYAEEKNIGNAETIITCGFSAGGMNIMSAIAQQYGSETPDIFYPDYVCDEVDQMSADMTIAMPIYGVLEQGYDFTVNSNIPPIFYVVGQNDPIFGPIAADSLTLLLSLGTDVSFFLAPDAVHGFGLGTGTENYINGYTCVADWMDLAITFLDTRLGYAEKEWDAFAQ